MEDLKVHYEQIEKSEGLKVWYELSKNFINSHFIKTGEMLYTSQILTLENTFEFRELVTKTCVRSTVTKGHKLIWILTTDKNEILTPEKFLALYSNDNWIYQSFRYLTWLFT